MTKKIYITNGSGRSGKDTFAGFISKYISVCRYSIAELPKCAAKVLGWDGSAKDDVDRKFLSDIMDLAKDYNDSPFRDVVSLAADFKKNDIVSEVMLIDMRDPNDIARAVKILGAETILIRNPKAEKIESNHADANVENYEYDYIIDNDGTLEQLDKVAKYFVENIIKNTNYVPIQTMYLSCVINGQVEPLVGLSNAKRSKSHY